MGRDLPRALVAAPAPASAKISAMYAAEVPAGSARMRSQSGVVVERVEPMEKGVMRIEKHRRALGLQFLDWHPFEPYQLWPCGPRRRCSFASCFWKCSENHASSAAVRRSAAVGVSWTPSMMSRSASSSRS